MSGPVTTVGTALALASLGLTLDNLRRLRLPDPAARPEPEPVCVLVPMRDEAHHAARCVGAVLDALDELDEPGAGRARVVVLDDGSTDGTGEVLAALAGTDPRLRVVTGRPRPPGWLGKPWACHQLAALAGDATVLVFVDADVVLALDGLRSTLGLLRTSGLDLVCPYPRQEAVGAAERLVQPLLVWSWMSTLPLGAAERSPRPSLTAANGQLLAVDAAAYRRSGGHAAVRGDVLEDLALLRVLKRHGGRGVVADGRAVASCRMYDGWPALRAGYRKSLWAAFGSTAGAAGATALLVTVHVVPAVAALRGSRTGLVGYAASVASRVLVARRTGNRAWPDALAHPVSVGLVAALTADSVVGRRRGRLAWKGRPVEVPTGPGSGVRP